MAKQPRKEMSRRRGAQYTVQRRETEAQVAAELAAGEHNEPEEDVRLINAFDYILEDIRGLAGSQHPFDKYRPEYDNVAREMCKLGATDLELARALGVSLSTMWGWQSRHDSFFRACLIGEAAAQQRVERALYQRAVGYTYPEVDLRVVDKEIVMTPVLKHIPPDVGACTKWLQAHDRKKWGNQAQLEVSSDEGFTKLWAMVSQGSTVPVLEGPSSGDELAE